MESTKRRFACSQCGKCCNRSPEVELSEAARLADVFVFRLLFRLYSLPLAPERGGERSSVQFHQKKSLLAAHAAHKYPGKVMLEGKALGRIHYLMISALALDREAGACAALKASRCTIYDRRPLACRTVPFHYSRPEALAESDFDRFVSTSGYGCDVGEQAPVVLAGGRILDAATQEARAQALVLGNADRPWKKAIVRRMKASSRDGALPSIEEVEMHAGFAALTSSMRCAWQIAAEERLISDAEARRLVQLQLRTIERMLASESRVSGDTGTLLEMAAEYRSAAHDRLRI